MPRRVSRKPPSTGGGGGPAGLLGFVLAQLPPPPARVLEVGCGDRGGLVRDLASAGYDALGVDPRAPEGPAFRHGDFRELDEAFDAAVAVRALHHVDALDDAVAKLASLAPVLVVDELAPERVGGPAQDWYEEQYRRLVAAGRTPEAPASLDEWRARAQAAGLHESGTLLAALRSHYEERLLEWRPYLYRWLRTGEEAERSLVDAGAFAPIGYRWAGARTSTTRSSAESR